MSKFLDKSGVQTLWGKVKEAVSNSANEFESKLGAANGIATLGSDSKLTPSQLPALKTINGESVVGSGNITIDLGIYQIVDSLPASNQNPNKIYLVLTSPATQQEQDVYTEYLWTGTGWEKLGEYKAAIDLAPYLKKEDIVTEVSKAGFAKLSETEVVSDIEFESSTNGVEAKISITDGDEGTSKADVTGTIPKASATGNGVMTSDQFTKLGGIAEQATKDEAITSEELAAILV